METALVLGGIALLFLSRTGKGSYATFNRAWQETLKFEGKINIFQSRLRSAEAAERNDSLWDVGAGFVVGAVVSIYTLNPMAGIAAGKSAAALSSAIRGAVSSHPNLKPFADAAEAAGVQAAKAQQAAGFSQIVPASEILRIILERFPEEHAQWKAAFSGTTKCLKGGKYYNCDRLGNPIGEPLSEEEAQSLIDNTQNAGGRNRVVVKTKLTTPEERAAANKCDPFDKWVESETSKYYNLKAAFIKNDAGRNVLVAGGHITAGKRASKEELRLYFKRNIAQRQKLCK